MSRAKRSRTLSTARGRASGFASRDVAAPEPASSRPTPAPGHGFPPVPPLRSARLRISGTNPWSVTLMSFLLLGGLGVCVLGAVLAASVIVDIVAPGEGPAPSQTLFVAAVALALEVLLGTAVAGLYSLMHNYTARSGNGVRVTLADAPGDPAPAGARGDEAREA
ncbi:hypothetical protein [Streptomyces sp. NPDC059168]|uniref:hypothetical protein n=1 Tax=Streptomyces sp. NPDC059168 TaxID=3346753 RepID=UPI00367F41AB